MSDTYYTVEFRAFAFETREKADVMADKLTDAFCEMPEAKGYGASTSIIEEVENEDPELTDIRKAIAVFDGLPGGITLTEIRRHVAGEKALAGSISAEYRKPETLQ